MRCGTFFDFGNLATGYFSGKLFFDGHSSGNAGYNDIGREFLSCEGAEKKGVRTHTDGIRIIYIDAQILT